MTSRISRDCGGRDCTDGNRNGDDSRKENALHGFSPLEKCLLAKYQKVQGGHVKSLT
jgi:hypothetical protein